MRGDAGAKIAMSRIRQRDAAADNHLFCTHQSSPGFDDVLAPDVVHPYILTR